MRLTLLTLLYASLAGCGYQFIGSGTILPPDVKTVAIPLVQNNTTEPGLTTVLTESLRDSFERYGTVSVVDSEDDPEADAVLRAAILKIRRDTHSTTSRTDNALEQESTLVVGAELKRKNGTILWRDPAVSVSQAYGAQSSAVVRTSVDFAEGLLGGQDVGALSSREIARGQEQQVLQDLAEGVARKIYDEAVAPDF